MTGDLNFIQRFKGFSGTEKRGYFICKQMVIVSDVSASGSSTVSYTDTILCTGS